MTAVTIVGGGLAGLIAAVECAEQGVPVRLLEARSRLGGRATTTPGPFMANHGPHAFYRGPLWDWLAARDLHGPFRVPRSPAVRFRWRGTVRAVPPKALLKGHRPLRSAAPVDRSAFDWLASSTDGDTARAVSNFAGPLTFDHDPGRLSASFVAHRVRRILLRFPPAARYVVGGWGEIVSRLGGHARRLGVEVELDAKVDRLDDLGGGPVILAVAPRSARAFLDDDTLMPESPEVLLYDLGLEARRGDPYVVFDLDEAGFVDRYTAVDPTLAPPGHSLVQAMIGVRPGEDRAGAVRRMEALLDAALPDWRRRRVWDRQAQVRESTGALDLPGETWRDRAPVACRPDLWLAGDWVAAPGHLAEVSHASAVAAARAAAAVALPGAPHPPEVAPGLRRGLPRRTLSTMEKGTRGEMRAHVDAPAERLYDMVSDVTRMGEWSPETVKCRWIGGATGPAPGARFKGTNRRGIFRWSTKPEVVTADPGREFAFVTKSMGPSTKWTYRFEATPDGGTDLSESFEMVDDESAALRFIERRFMRIEDRKADLEQGMQRTLERIKAVAEGGA